MAPRTKTLDDDFYASEPGQITLSERKLRVLRPDLFFGLGMLWRFLREIFFDGQDGLPQRTYIEEQLREGDSRAAVVVSVEPLLVAAYSDDLDCVAMLKFPSCFVADYQLSVGTRLLTVNCYGSGGKPARDLIPGTPQGPSWTEIHPLIAEFLTEDLDRLRSRKEEIEEDEWQRAWELGNEYLKLRPGVARDGRPVFSANPARLRRRSSAQARE